MHDLQFIISEGFQLLKQKKGYRNIDLLKKFETLDCKVSTASFSKIINNRKVGIDVLKKVHFGITKVIESELGYLFNETQNRFTQKELPKNWVPEDISLPDSRQQNPSNGIIFHHEGRLPVHEKIAFTKSAQKEVVEVGARLRTFVDYFESRSEYEFAGPVKSLLEKGVSFKLFILDPNSNEALLYFRDRASFLEKEAKSIEVIREVLDFLMAMQRSLAVEKYPGKFEIYTYKRIPYNHFYIIDGATPYGKMMVSNYLFGIRRADCPLVELTKKSNPNLFRRYYKSYRSFIQGARKIK